MNNTPKLRRLDHARRGRVAELARCSRVTCRRAVTALKQQPGKNIVMSGSATLARSLLREGLVDELHLIFHPVVVGQGARLFEDGDKHALELADSKTFGSGVVYAMYRPAAARAHHERHPLHRRNGDRLRAHRLGCADHRRRCAVLAGVRAGSQGGGGALRIASPSSCTTAAAEVRAATPRPTRCGARSRTSSRADRRRRRHGARLCGLSSGAVLAMEAAARRTADHRRNSFSTRRRSSWTTAGPRHPPPTCRT